MYGDKFKQATQSLMDYCREQLGYDKDPDVHYVTDKNNANNMLGYTAHYQPDKKVVTVYISNRHPKDALRSLSHELVHHAQNVRGDLQNTQTEEGYAQTDPHMRNMEEEAYLKGNMMFRDWEDSCKSQNTLKLNMPISLEEKNMSNLKETIKRKILAKLQEGFYAPDDVEVGGRHRYKSEYAAGFKDGRRGQLPASDFFLDQLRAAREGGEETAYVKGHRKGSKIYYSEDYMEDDVMEEGEKPDFPDVDGDGDRQEPISKAQKDKKAGKGDKKEKSDKDLSKVPPQLRKHVAKKKVNENELTDIKSKQSSIKSLNENRNKKLNEELMRRLLK